MNLLCRLFVDDRVRLRMLDRAAAAMAHRFAQG